MVFQLKDDKYISERISFILKTTIANFVDDTVSNKKIKRILFNPFNTYIGILITREFFDNIILRKWIGLSQRFVKN